MKKILIVFLAILMVGCQSSGFEYDEKASQIDIRWYDGTLKEVVDEGVISDMYNILESIEYVSSDSSMVDESHQYNIRIKGEPSILISNGSLLIMNKTNYKLTDETKVKIEQLFDEYLPKEEMISVELEAEEIPVEVTLEGFELVGKLADGSDLFYKRDEPYYVTDVAKEIIVIKNGVISYEVRGQYTLPTISPDLKSFAYVDGVGFEVIGDLKVITEGQTRIFASEKVVELASNGRTAKSCEWYDDNNIFMIIGSNTGTISQGGDAYLLDFTSGRLRMIIDSKLGYEVTTLTYTEPELKYEVVHWTDSSYINYEYISTTIVLEEFMSVLPIRVEDVE